MKRFLIVNPYGIGDVLFSTPLLRALKDHFPDSLVGYLCNRRTQEVLETHPLVHRLFVYEKDDLRRQWRESKGRAIGSLLSLVGAIRRERFEVLLDFSLAPEFSFCLKWAGIPRRIGLDYKGRGRFLTERILLPGFDEKPIPDYYLETLQVLGVELGGKRYRTEIWVTEEDKRFAEEFLRRQGLSSTTSLIGISPGGGGSFGGVKASYRHWGREFFSELCDLLEGRLKRPVLLFWGPGEEEICKAVVEGCRQSPFLSPKTTVRQMASLMKQCALIITNDGGPLHVAVAARVPTLSLFGPVDEKVYGPYPPGAPHRILNQPVPCRPCYQRFKLPECERNVCLQWMEPSRVFEAAKECLTHAHS